MDVLLVLFFFPLLSDAYRTGNKMKEKGKRGFQRLLGTRRLRRPSGCPYKCYVLAAVIQV